MIWIWLPFLGFFMTLYAISIGRSGGLLYVGALTTFAGVQPAAAISTSLAILVPTAIVGAISHWRKGNVSIRLGCLLLLSGSLGTLVVTELSRYISPAVCKKLIGLIFLWTLCKLIFDYIKKRNAVPKSDVELRVPSSHTWAPLSYGALAGVISGLSGMSGSTAIMAGLLSCGCPPIQLIGTSLFAVAGISLTGFLTHFELGSVSWRLVAGICAGSVIASAISPLLLSKIPKNHLDRFFPVVMILLIAAMTGRLLLGSV